VPRNVSVYKVTPQERNFYNFFSELLVDFVGAEPYLPLIKQTYRELVARVTASLF
jgi:hypothetical protein